MDQPPVGSGSGDHRPILTGNILDRSQDSGLQNIVEMASRETAYPTAMVSLVLRNTVLFKAHIGLPALLAASGSAGRCSSYCQYVVNEGRIIDIPDVDDMPGEAQRFARRYGIRAYYGVPIYVRERVVGSLCVMDIKPRFLSAAGRETLLRLARLATSCVEELTTERSRATRLLSHATESGFDVLGNSLIALTSAPAMGRMLLADLDGLSQLAQVAAARPAEATGNDAVTLLQSFSNSSDSLKQLRELFDLVERSGERVATIVASLQKILRWDLDHCDLEQAVQTALDLTDSSPRITVNWYPPAQPVTLRGQLGQAISLLTVIFATINRVIAPGAGSDDNHEKLFELDLRCLCSLNLVRLQYGAPSLQSPVWQEVLATVLPYVESMTDVVLEIKSPGLCLFCPLAKE